MSLQKLRAEMRENLDLILRLKKNDDDLKSERLALQLERDEAAKLQVINVLHGYYHVMSCHIISYHIISYHIL